MDLMEHKVRFKGWWKTKELISGRFNAQGEALGSRYVDS